MVSQQEPQGLNSSGVAFHRVLDRAGACPCPCTGAQPSHITSVLEGQLLPGMLGEAQVQSCGISRPVQQNRCSVLLLVQQRTKRFPLNALLPLLLDTVSTAQGIIKAHRIEILCCSASTFISKFFRLKHTIYLEISSTSSLLPK